MIPEMIIGGIFLFPTRITDPRAEDTIETAELGVWSPKSSEAEGRGLKFHFCGLGIQRQFRR